MGTTDTLQIGSAPANEECAQVGSPGYAERARAECARFIEAIRAALGPEPEGARLIVKGYPHDFGTYYEVAVRFDPEVKAAVDYAYRCDAEAPADWPADDAVALAEKASEDQAAAVRAERVKMFDGISALRVSLSYPADWPDAVRYSSWTESKDGAT